MRNLDVVGAVEDRVYHTSSTIALLVKYGFENSIQSAVESAKENKVLESAGIVGNADELYRRILQEVPFFLK
jgi:hypothetical protein